MYVASKARGDSICSVCSECDSSRKMIPHVVVRCLRGEAASILRLRHAMFLEAWESFTCLGWPTVAGER